MMMSKENVVELGYEEGKSSSNSKSFSRRGISMLDFVLRLIGIVGTMASAIAMATTDETLPFATRFVRFKANYDDLPTFTLFVVVNGVVGGYLVVSLSLSILHIVMLGFLTAGASASAAIVYLAHQGNTTANWFAICQQFNSFCGRISGSLIGSFVGVAVFILIILLSAVALARS
ncbi:hypothetical protein F8388_025584 [Cannabis sativa]|uniref:CASP-like protein n=1 Tax=Cannabis sativa TaxID=3483 RepID=A0A7J6G136_CANSA|nr:hypothetical protein F8388_025584 [Cannabis sativa]